MQTGMAATTLIASIASAAADAVLLDESDPKAVALGYHADATQTDKARFPNYTSGDKCSACTLFETQTGTNTGGCSAFPGKLVAAGGWCSAFSVAI